ILREQLGATWIEGCWRLRLSRGASLWRQARSGRLPHRLLALEGHGHVRMLWPQEVLLHGQGALVELLSLGILAAGVQERRQVVGERGHVGMLGAKRPGGDG